MVFDKDGETPLDDTSGLIPNITTRAELDEVEAENILEAHIKYTTSPEQLKNITFSTAFLQQLHKDMLGNVWNWAGTFRTTQTSIGINAINIRTELYQLMDNLSFWETTWDYKETATRLHHRLVQIHPFPNGNGRCARLFTDLWLLSKGKNMSEWGDEDINDIGETRTEYLSALREADDRSYERLEHFIFP